MPTTMLPMPEIEIVAEGLQFPEGPIIMPDGSIILVEIARGTLSRVTPTGTIEVIADLGGGPNGAAIGPDGAVYVCNNGGFAWSPEGRGVRPVGPAPDYAGGRIDRVDLSNGRSEVLYTGTGDVALKGPNDIVFDRTGGFWFTDLGKTRHRDWDRTGVFYASADGNRIVEAAHPLVTPNGIGLSPDERVLYVAETQTGRLWAFDVAAPGEIARQPWPSPHGGRIVASTDGYRNFDSLAVEASGRICVATLMDGGISVIDPETGAIEHVPMPDRYTTNICFGGDDMRDAYITQSIDGRLLRCRWPRPGLKLNY